MQQLGEWRHICVDMQRMFSEDTPWRVEWLQRIAPQVEEVARHHAERSIFTRFVPPARPDEAAGTWRAYYEKWWMMTREQLPPGMVDLIPSLAACVPPGKVFDKPIYSPWLDGRLHAALTRDRVSTLVITGGETDVCVLATAFGAIDLGYRVVLLEDAVCSGADETHDASLKLLGDRFSVQLELVSTESFLSAA